MSSILLRFGFTEYSSSVSHLKFCISYLRFFITLFTGCFLILSGCDQSFQPLQENDKYYFSMYGYLDVSADTQWVRIGTPRGAIDETPNPEGIAVTLENLQSGQSVIMNDSLFAIGNFLNYWTTMKIENEQTYRIKAERQDGKWSQVTVTTPRELPTPIVFESTFPPYGYSVLIDDTVEHIADVESKWYVLLNPNTERIRKTYTFTYKNKVEHTEAYGGKYVAFAPREEETNYIEYNSANTEYTVVYQQFFVASAGPEWDDNISSINNLEYSLDETSSDVENGLGYVVGIESKWVPFKPCVTPDGSLAVPCPAEKPYW